MPVGSSAVRVAFKEPGHDARRVGAFNPSVIAAGLAKDPKVKVVRWEDSEGPHTLIFRPDQPGACGYLLGAESDRRAKPVSVTPLSVEPGASRPAADVGVRAYSEDEFLVQPQAAAWPTVARVDHAGLSLEDIDFAVPPEKFALVAATVWPGHGNDPDDGTHLFILQDPLGDPLNPFLTVVGTRYSESGSNLGYQAEGIHILGSPRVDEQGGLSIPTPVGTIRRVPENERLSTIPWFIEGPPEGIIKTRLAAADPSHEIPQAVEAQIAEFNKGTCDGGD
jgi:hypothetical protein